MGNRMYFAVLAILIIVLWVLRVYFFHDPSFIFIAGGILALYIWCKEEFAGTGWFAKKKQPLNINKPAPVQFTANAVAEPISIHEKQGYLQLMHELINPAFHDQLGAFINQLKTFDDSNDELEPLYALSEFTYEKSIAFIAILDWKADITELVWRIEIALKQNYSATIELPSATQWEPRASVSYDNVFTTFDKVLRFHDFQLGFLNTGGDNYALFVFKTAQKNRVQEAVKLTGYSYYEVVA